MTHAPDPLPVTWHPGSPTPKYDTAPDIQEFVLDDDTVILRQNMTVSFEAPFLYLLFGRDRALLLDTGATPEPELFPLRRTVDRLVQERGETRRHPGPYPLLVLHTHSHDDHTAGDGQFAGRPNTELVGARLDDAWPWFGFDVDPERVARIDLGGRIVEAFATPGHHENAVTYFDEATGFLLTGDTVYPGRLYVFDWPAFDRTITRLLRFCADRPVTRVLGCHVEMSTTPGQDFPVGMSHHPGERALELTVESLQRIRDVIDAHGGRPGRYVLDELIVYPIPEVPTTTSP